MWFEMRMKYRNISTYGGWWSIDSLLVKTFMQLLMKFQIMSLNRELDHQPPIKFPVSFKSLSRYRYRIIIVWINCHISKVVLLSQDVSVCVDKHDNKHNGLWMSYQLGHFIWKKRPLSSFSGHNIWKMRPLSRSTRHEHFMGVICTVCAQYACLIVVICYDRTMINSIRSWSRSIIDGDVMYLYRTSRLFSICSIIYVVAFNLITVNFSMTMVKRDSLGAIRTYPFIGTILCSIHTTDW
jgi:hypothetical protein